MKPQVQLDLILSDQGTTFPVRVLMPGETTMADLQMQCLKALSLQHPHHACKPIIGIKYDVRANTRKETA